MNTNSSGRSWSPLKTSATLQNKHLRRTTDAKADSFISLALPLSCAGMAQAGAPRWRGLPSLGKARAGRRPGPPQLRPPKPHVPGWPLSRVPARPWPGAHPSLHCCAQAKRRRQPRGSVCPSRDPAAACGPRSGPVLCRRPEPLCSHVVSPPARYLRASNRTPVAGSSAMTCGETSSCGRTYQRPASPPLWVSVTSPCHWPHSPLCAPEAPAALPPAPVPRHWPVRCHQGIQQPWQPLQTPGVLAENHVAVPAGGSLSQSIKKKAIVLRISAGDLALVF